MALPLLAALGCGEPERAAQLRQEIGRLETERVDRETVEKARAELAQVEERLATARAALEARSGEPEAIAREQAALQRGAAAERAAAAELASERERVLGEAQRALEEAQALDQQVARARARAQWARAQLALFAREIRPEDPDWATERRVAALRELLVRLQTEWGKDPVLAAASAEVASAPPERARALADRIGSRFARVYDLPEPSVGTGAEAAPQASPEAAPQASPEAGPQVSPEAGHEEVAGQRRP